MINQTLHLANFHSFRLGFTLDSINGLCYQVLPDSDHAEAGQDACDNLDAELLQFENDKQVLGLLSMLKAGWD